MKEKSLTFKARLGDSSSALVFMVLICTGQRITTFNQFELFVLICIEDWEKKIYCLTISFFLVLFALQESNILLSTD